MSKKSLTATRPNRPAANSIADLLRIYDHVDAIREHAACRGIDKGVFFPADETKGARRKAREYCDGCPVFAKCASWGVKQTYGIWAGEYVWKLRKIRSSGVDEWDAFRRLLAE